MRGLLREILITVLLGIAIYFLLRTVIDSRIVIGPSMEPSFHTKDRILAIKVVYNFREPRRGDVIILEPPVHASEDFIKRIIGLPGDTLEVKSGKVYINGSALDEPYIKQAPGYTMPPRKIPAAHYFVLGDNRNNSNDSHNGWLVPRENILAKVWVSLWPPGVVPNYNLDEQVSTLTSKKQSYIMEKPLRAQ